MKSCGIRLGWVATGLVLAGLSATAAASDLRPLSDSEMSDVSGRGLVAPVVLAALGAQDQRASYGSADDALAAEAEQSSQSASQMLRQMASLQAQSGSVGMQNAIKDAQMMSKIAQTLAATTATLPTLAALPGLLGLVGAGMGGLGALGALGSLGALGGLNGLTTQSQPPVASNSPASPAPHGH